MQKFFDIFVAKEYETRQSGQPEKKTAWNKVGRGWPSRSGESISFELFLVPNIRYVMQMREHPKQETESAPAAEVF